MAPPAERGMPLHDSGIETRRGVGGSDNRLLGMLPHAVRQRIGHIAERVLLTPHQVIYHSDGSVEHVYFPIHSLVSIVTTMHGGESVEIGTIGREGFVGVSSLFGSARALFETVVLLPGPAWRIPVRPFQQLLSESKELQQITTRYVHFSLSQLAQTAACNRLHTLVQRCCRWLLTASDGIKSDTLPLTHEFLALTLGVRRPGLTTVLGHLHRGGLIQQQRGHITIVDRAQLEGLACECYATLLDDYDSLLDPPASI